MTIIAHARPLPGTALADLDTADLAPHIGRAAIPTQRTGPVQMPACPPWCTNTHPVAPADADPTDLDTAFEYSNLHERFVANVITREAESARDDDLMHNAVELEAFDSFDRSIDNPPSVMLTLQPRGPRAEAFRGEQSRLTPEQAEELGRALIEAARMARMSR